MSAAMPLRVGTRGSPLALIQTREVVDLLRARHAGPVEEVVIRTTGDTVQDRRLAEIGGKGLFAKEIHDALSRGRIGCAVHSLKDLETSLPPGIVLGCTLPRADARDALILAKAEAAIDPANPFACLPAGAVVGTASIRRQAQLLHARPDIVIATLRGNVQTRLRKLADGACTASLLALAGLMRLGLAARADVVLDPDLMLPAAGQGIIGVTVRQNDSALREVLAGIDDPGARAAATAERAMLLRLDGSCRTPIAAYAQLLPHGSLHLTGLVARGDGSFLLKRGLHGGMADAERIGRELGDSLRTDSPHDIFD
jgi:hydroxymethylbilane synthase